VGLATGYIIAIFGEIAIFGVTVFYFASYAGEWDWFSRHINAGCTATSPNHYGIPTTMICPQGMVENITTLLAIVR
jgi:hypothetical protein